MSVFLRGSLQFEKIWVEDNHGEEVVVRERDCFPPPAGTVDHSNPPTEIEIDLRPRFFQATERANVVEGAREAGEADLTIAQVIEEMAAAFELKTRTVDLKNVPAEWDEVAACFTSSIRYRVQYAMFEIRVTATKDLTLGGEDYPKGDLVASFRVWRPDRYSVVRRFEWNPKCCSETPSERPPEWAMEIHPFVVPKFRLRYPEIPPIVRPEGLNAPEGDIPRFPYSPLPPSPQREDEPDDQDEDSSDQDRRSRRRR